jgi:hypothetical protein
MRDCCVRRYVLYIYKQAHQMSSAMLGNSAGVTAARLFTRVLNPDQGSGTSPFSSRRSRMDPTSSVRQL